MPEKLERCVEEIMKKQGISKERAYAICNASINDGIIFDFESKLKLTVDETTGFLTAPVVLSRVGVQHYYGYELGLTDDRIFEKVGVFRPPEEVFSNDSLKSFVNMVVTDDHPSGLVTVSNVRGLQVGTVSSPKANKEKGIVEGIITITCEDQIKKTDNGKVEVSVGYIQDLIERSGNYNGENYDFVQTNIRGNHLAIVDAGRCGAACKIITDHGNKKESIMVITIDGIEYDIENKQLAQAIQNQQKTHDASIEEMKKKKENAEDELEEMKKKKEEAEAAKDAALKKVLSDEQLSELVKDHVNMVVEAKMILGDKMPECGVCPKEIKSAIIDHVYGETDLTGKSEDYVNAMYDMALKDAKKSKDGFEKFKKNMEDTKGKEEITRDSARIKYMKTIGLEV